jgi:hypothetical protein
MREILDDGFAQLDGAPAGLIVADFERPPVPRSRTRFAEQQALDSPQVTFGSAKRSKPPRSATPVAQTGKVDRASREIKPAKNASVSPRPRAPAPAALNVADAKANAARGANPPVTRAKGQPAAKPAPDKHAGKPPLLPAVKKAPATEKAKPASPPCKTAKCKS